MSKSDGADSYSSLCDGGECIMDPDDMLWFSGLHENDGEIQQTTKSMYDDPVVLQKQT